MKITRHKIPSYNDKNFHGGSCNFCNKGELNEIQMGLKYPYDEVIQITTRDSGHSQTFVICDDCKEILIDKLSSV